MTVRSYLLIESRGPHENPDAGDLLDLGVRLRAAGHAVTVFLIQNAVVALSASDVWSHLVDRGVEVVADDYSIAARGLDPAERPAGVGVGGAGDLVRLLMAEGTVGVWH